MFRRRPPHKHKWITVSGGPDPDSNSSTMLLQRCICGEYNTEYLDGVWTREELGIDDKAVADLKLLLNDLTEENNG